MNNATPQAPSPKAARKGSYDHCFKGPQYPLIPYRDEAGSYAQSVRIISRSRDESPARLVDV
jgi:hypothetical protein